MVKHFALSFILSLFTLSVSAQDFLRIPAEDFPVLSDKVPTFSTQITLGNVVHADEVGVELLYPEFKELTANEVRTLKQLHYQADEHPRLETSIAVSRKQGTLEVSFTPIVKRGGKWYRITSCKLQAKSATSATTTPQPLTAPEGRYADNSVLASGKWVKIYVDKEGVYELTEKQLKDMGFSNPSAVRVFGYGGNPIQPSFTFTGSDALIDDLCEVATYHKGKSVLFFAEGTTRWTWSYPYHVWERAQNIFSKHSYYFVTEGGTPLAIEPVDGATDVTDTFDFTMSHAIYEKDDFAWYEGGAEFYDSYDYINGNSQNYTLNLPGLIAERNGRLSVAFSAASSLHSSTIATTLNDVALGNLAITAFSTSTESAREGRTHFTTTDFTEKSRINLELTANTNGHLNYLIASYPRALSGTDESYAFIPLTSKAFGSYSNPGRPATLLIANASNSTQVWKIGRGTTSTQQIRGELTGSDLTVNIPNNQERYVIVDINRTYASPTVVGQVANQNLHADEASDMIIILPESGKLTQAATRLAQRHEADGLRVRLVTADKLYNEFSSGTPNAAAYRRYLKMLYDRAESEADMPRYLLLFGDCYWDNRFLTTSGDPKDYLLAYEVSQTDRTTNISIGTMENYATDDYFGMLDDGEGGNMATRDKVDLGIGRFLAHDLATANILVDKSISYMDNEHTGMWKNDVYMLADYGDNNLHMRDSESASEVIENLNKNLIINKVFWDAYPITSQATGNTFPQVTEMLQNDLKKGGLIFNYVGHGDPHQISHAKLLRTSDFEAATDGNMPLWVFASCEITPYDQQLNDLGRATLYNKQGGTVALVCANRSVQASANKSMNMEYIRYVLSYDTTGEVYTLGDAMRLAKNRLINNSLDNSINKLKYALLGDPALRLIVPKEGVVLDAINGQPMDDYNDTQLKAGQVVEFSGHITQPNRQGIDEGFNGILTARIYDRDVTITCKKNDTETTRAFTYHTRPNKVYEGSARVENGEFTLSFIVPRNISYTEDPGRVVFYAISDDKSREVNGTNEQFYLKGTADSDVDDTEGPQITMYLNEPDFPDGGIVGSDPTFIVELDDISGINFNGLSIGHNLELIIDDDIDHIITLNDYFNYYLGSLTTGQVSYPLTGLSQGWHTLTFRAWDLLDNASTQTLTFFVREGIPNNFDINAVQNADGASIELTVSFGTPTSGGLLEVEIYDVVGRRIWLNRQHVDNGTTYYSTTWDLQDYGNRAVPSGLYIYRAVLSGNNGKSKTKGKKTFVKRP